MKNSWLSFLLLFCIFSCNSKNFEKVADGIIVNPINGPSKVIKLQVISDEIIHVTAGTEKLENSNSLILVENLPLSNRSGWSISEEDSIIYLNTSKIKASISLVTGEICFFDINGSPVLREQIGGGKYFDLNKIDEKELFSAQQIFESTEDEAFYGLGQHQDDQMNYKGEDVDLFQYNSKVSIPFVVSNKNYGILWDNYSRSKFGDKRDYGQLSAALKLYNEKGNEGGLTAKYVSYENPSEIYTEREESDIDYEFIKDLVKFPTEFPMEKGKVVWRGFIKSDSSGKHKFRVYSAGYVKLWIGDSLKVDRWREAWNPSTTLFTSNLEKNKQYPIKIEWNPDGGQSYFGLKALTPLPEGEQEKLSLFSEAAKQIDYYFIIGGNLDEVIKGYRLLTGKSPIMPKWAMGFWQSRERYRSQEELLSVVREFRKRQIPLDNIVLDWQYWNDDQWGSHEFDSTRFPDPKGMITELHNDLHAKIMISVWPKFYVGTEHYDEFNSQGWLYKKNVNVNEKDWIGYVSTFYDAFNPRARELFWNQLSEHLYSKGVDAWWMDAAEPDIHSNLSMEERKDRMNPTALGSSTEFFNAYPLVNAKAIYEGQMKENPNQRVFILTRSSFAGQQKYAAATWSGDIASTWNEMKRQIPAGLNFSLSGIPYWTMDIGGFFVENRFEKPKEEDIDEWRELNARWYQFGAFCPLFRAHGQFPHREVFNIAPEGHPAYKSILYYNRLRYRMMPYIYTLAGKTWFDDYTIMRALVMDFGKDKMVQSISDQYMFGPSFLICPIYEYKATSREVYLPAGTGWYEFNTGNYFSGGNEILAQAPYERMPVFVKEGAIIPFGPEIEYTTEKPADPLILYVYTGKDGEFELYEDENVNNNYKKNAFSTIPFSYNEASKTLTVGERKGEFPGMLKQRKIQVVWVTKDKPVQPDFAANSGDLIEYSGQRLKIPMN